MTIRPVDYLRVFLVVLFLVPAYYILPGVGAAGSLPTVFGLVALAWWLLARLALGHGETAEPNPVRWALLAWAGVVLASWVAGKRRVLTALESSESDRALLVMLGLVGIALVTMDGLRTREQVERVARTVAAASMIMVTVAVVQFYVGTDLAETLRPPGLVDNFAEGALDVRSIFTRPRGTAMHPIELGVVGAALVPVAYWARSTRSGRLAWTAPVAGLAFAAMISLSRSAVLAMAVAAAVLVVALPWRRRLNLAVGGALFVVAAGLMVDGLVGTLRSLVLQAGNDPSVAARVERFPLVMELVAEHPWFGRGYGTFTVQEGFLLDNEIHGTMITMGLLGLAALLLFVGFVVTIAWRTGAGQSPERRVAGGALAATILGLFVSSYTFDAFYYQILTNLLYLSIGMVGAMWRVTTAAAPAQLPAGSARAALSATV